MCRGGSTIFLTLKGGGQQFFLTESGGVRHFFHIFVIFPNDETIFLLLGPLDLDLGGDGKKQLIYVIRFM